MAGRAGVVDEMSLPLASTPLGLLRQRELLESGQQREAARVDDGEAAGDERDRDRNRADPRSS
jgi:hypothetical protein